MIDTIKHGNELTHDGHYLFTLEQVNELVAEAVQRERKEAAHQDALFKPALNASIEVQVTLRMIYSVLAHRDSPTWTLTLQNFWNEYSTALTALEKAYRQVVREMPLMVSEIDRLLKNLDFTAATIKAAVMLAIGDGDGGAALDRLVAQHDPFMDALLNAQLARLSTEYMTGNTNLSRGGIWIGNHINTQLKTVRKVRKQWQTCYEFLKNVHGRLLEGTDSIEAWRWFEVRRPDILATKANQGDKISQDQLRDFESEISRYKKIARKLAESQVNSQQSHSTLIDETC